MYTPNKWVILKTTNKDEILYRVLADWSGGYLDSDMWRLSSGITKISEDGDYYLIENHSGSVYKCHKNTETLGKTAGLMYNEWLKENKDDINLELISMENMDEFK
jgi:hypothetical protein